MIIYQYKSPIGVLLLEFHNGTFTKLDITQANSDSLKQASPLPNPYSQDLDAYFRGKPITFEWPIKLQGTPFQIQVWQSIREIPYGKTTTYKKIGEKIRSKGYQAIGSAVGRNPLAIIIPCHRVLGTRSLGGYHYGLMIKNFLLKLENALPDTTIC